MNRKLYRYVGRIVRLNKQAFREIRQQAIRKGYALENCFIVSEVSRGVKKLICYGANIRVVVSASDVVLV